MEKIEKMYAHVMSFTKQRLKFSAHQHPLALANTSKFLSFDSIITITISQLYTCGTGGAGERKCKSIICMLMLFVMPIILDCPR